MRVFFKQYYHFETSKINYVNLGHLIFRAVNFFMLSVLMIYASYFAMKAEINFGVVSSCLSIGAPLNCVFGYIFWRERLSKIILLGTAIILCGVVWVAMAKGKVLTSEDAKIMSEEDRMYYKICSISCAIFSAFLGSMRIQQAKYVNIKLKYSPMDFSIDAGVVLGFVILVISLVYYIQGHPSYTWYNFGVSFVASTFQMVTGLVGLNCVVKGLGGPTSAILQTQAVVGIVLNTVFLGLVPSLQQICGSLIALGGVFFLLVFKDK